MSASRGISFADVRDAAPAEYENKLGELVAAMTLDEKIHEMSGRPGLLAALVMPFRYNWRTYNAGGCERLGIPPVRFTDGPRGVSLNHSTCFPVSMGRGAAFDAGLEERVADAMGIESRALGANYNGGVCINLLRHPGWGRAQETFGEDPHHLAVMGRAMVRGFQKHVMACAKHYACNSVERARFKVDVKIGERTLREVYLPHFKACVDEGVASIMSAYNKVEGHFCGHNKMLLQNILKKDWGFEGFVVSDFLLGIRGPGAAAKGLDIEMPFTIHYGRRLKKKVMKGAVAESDIDEAVARIVRTKARFAKVGAEGAYAESRVACPEHTALALEAARKSLVLLKNDKDTLPFDPARLKKIAVIGKLAKVANLGDKGSSQVYPPYAVSPLEGIKNRVGLTARVVYCDGKDPVEARKIARDADACVVVAGLDHRHEGEYIPVLELGGDREKLSLPARQEELIRAVADENSRTAVVLEGGSAIIVEAWKDMVPSILMAWYPGMEGGNAIADALFGGFNPGGKLPLTAPRSLDQLPHFDMNAGSLEYGYYHGYRLFDKKGMTPAFAFGFGLSYTTFECRGLEARLAKGGDGGDFIEARVTVANTGGRAGDEVVQLYVGAPGVVVDRPVKELKDFARVSLEPGEEKPVTLRARFEDLRYWDEGKRDWALEPGEHKIYVGSSSRSEDLIESVVLIGGQ